MNPKPIGRSRKAKVAKRIKLCSPLGRQSNRWVLKRLITIIDPITNINPAPNNKKEMIRVWEGDNSLLLK